MECPSFDFWLQVAIDFLAPFEEMTKILESDEANGARCFEVMKALLVHVREFAKEHPAFQNASVPLHNRWIQNFNYDLNFTVGVLARRTTIKEHIDRYYITANRTFNVGVFLFQIPSFRSFFAKTR